MDQFSDKKSTNLVAALDRASWTWFNALARDLPIAAGVVGDHGALSTAIAQDGTTGSRLTGLEHSAHFQSVARETLATGEARRLTIDQLELLFTPLRTDRMSATVVVAADPNEIKIDERLLTAISTAVSANLALGADEEIEGFDRVSSLHRLLHDAVDRGVENDVVTAFVEAIFAWDGVEVSGYVQDLDGHWLLSVSAPGARRGQERVPALPSRQAINVASILSDEETTHFGFEASAPRLGATIGAPTVDPWLLIFADGYGPLRESRARLYIDLLREALERAAAIAETRAAWSILQHLLGSHDAEAAATAALGAVIRVLPSIGASITATSTTGAIVMSVGDDELHGSVRPFGRVSRLVAHTKLLDGCAIDLTLRRAAGQSFTRREQMRLDHLAGVFGAWLSRALKQGTIRRERRAERRDFDEVLDRAARQAARDGSDVSVMVISVPEVAARPALLRSWVVELRSRMRGSDLAGALSDREIGLLLCGTTPDTVGYVSARLCRHLKFGERGNPVGVVGIASIAAGHPTTGSLVQHARENLGRKAAVDGALR